MSFEITTAFVQQYEQNIMMLSQQMGSRLRKAVTVKEGIIGKRDFVDQVGVTAAQKKTTRHSDTPLISTPHARRALDLYDYEWADLIDQMDKIKTLNDPTNSYVLAGAAALGRSMDDEIINAFFATSITGETGSSTVAFPSGQQVAVNSWKYGTGSGNAGLTISKLIEAKIVLFGNEALNEEMPGNEAYIAVTAKQLGDLLATTEATNRNYAQVAALVEGKLDYFMGFNFIRLERLLTDGSGYRRVPVWNKTGMALGIGQDIKTRITERADKSYAVQPYACMSIGATRLEEKKVVEIKCLES